MFNTNKLVFNVNEFQMYRFLQKPPNVSLEDQFYINKSVNWIADIHLISTYVFLGQEERRIFAQQSHNMLIKQVHTFDFLGQSGTKLLTVESRDLVASMMFRFRRSDAKFRNEWSNYTNCTRFIYSLACWLFFMEKR